MPRLFVSSDKLEQFVVNQLLYMHEVAHSSLLALLPRGDGLTCDFIGAQNI